MAQLVKRRAAEDKLLKKQKQNCVFANKDEKRYSEGAYFQGVLWKTGRIWLCNHFILGRERKHKTKDELRLLQK